MRSGCEEVRRDVTEKVSKIKGTNFVKKEIHGEAWLLRESHKKR
jgi:hypothetical protein